VGYLSSLATKEQIRETKEDIKELAVATKQDIKELAVATKQDIKELAVVTNQDVKELSHKLDRMESSLQTYHKEFVSFFTKNTIETQKKLAELEFKK
jgi:hypothetical protein